MAKIPTFNDLVRSSGGVATNAQTGATTVATAQQMNTVAPQPMVMQPVQPAAAIPADQLKPQIPMSMAGTLPTPDPTQAVAAVEGTKAVANNLQTYIDKLEAPKTELSTQNEALVKELGSLYGQDVGQEALKQKTENQLGVGKIKNQLVDANSEIAMRTARLERQIATENLDPNNSSNQAYGRVANLRNAEAADIQILGARATALQGNLALATDEAQRAVDLKFKGIEENIDAKLNQIKVAEPLLTAEQKKIADAQTLMLADEKTKIEERKALTKTNLDLAFTSGLTNKFLNKNGQMFRASDGKPYESVEEFFADAGVSSFDEAYAKGLIGDLTADYLADRDFVLKARESYPDAGIMPSDDPEMAANKIRDNSYIFSKQTYIAPEVAPDNTSQIIKDGDKSYIMGDDGNLYPVSDFVNGAGTEDGYTQLSDQELKSLDATTEVKALKSLGDLKQKITDYKNLVQKNGFALTGEGKTQLNAAYSAAQIAWKEAAALGALTGPDLDLINNAIPPATGLGRLNPFGANPQGVLNTLESSLSRLNRDATTKYESLTSRNDKYQNAKYVQNLGKPFGLAPVESQTEVKGMMERLNPIPTLTYEKEIGNGKVIKGSPYHSGLEVDIDGKIGDPIVAKAGGKVIEVTPSKTGYGNKVVIQDAQGNTYIYGHLSGFSVKKGQEIPTGFVIGKMGNTGNVVAGPNGDGSHLHIEKRDKNGKLIPL